MAVEKFQAFNSRGNLLTTELDSLADSTMSAAGAVYDNSSNRDTFGRAELHVTFTVSPSEGHSVDLYGVPALDGTTYADDAPPSAACYLGSFQIHSSTSAQIITTPLFELPPCKLKFVAFSNSLGVSFPSSGSTIELFTTNRDIS